MPVGAEPPGSSTGGTCAAEAEASALDAPPSCGQIDRGDAAGMPGATEPLPKDAVIGRYVNHQNCGLTLDLTLKDFTNG